MKKWSIRGGIFLLVGATALAAYYEAGTQIGRGWLRGEAFFDGRPTSYWRGRIDRWAEHNHTHDTAAGFLAITPRRPGETKVVLVRLT